MKYLKKGMSVVELENLSKNTTSDKQKDKIDRQLEITKEKTKLFVDKLINSKWFKLGITQTIRKRQATRVLIGQNVIYELDPIDIMLNLIDLTIKSQKKSNKSWNFREELNKL